MRLHNSDSSKCTTINVAVLSMMHLFTWKWIKQMSQIGFAYPQVACREKIFLESFVDEVERLSHKSQDPDLQYQCTRGVSILTTAEINQDPRLIQEFLVFGARIGLRERFWKLVQSQMPSDLGCGSDTQVSISRSCSISSRNEEEE